ncbi:unnamed protein product [Acidithrix sp. C25]|nr:unnamed protein product [Acidithrix sp. C25]
MDFGYPIRDRAIEEILILGLSIHMAINRGVRRLYGTIVH